MLEEDIISSEEQLVLKFISEEQKTSFVITAEEKIINNTINRESISKCLKSLIKKNI